MSEQRKWVVTASGDRPLADVREAARKAGFATEASLDEIGVLTGAATRDAAAAIRALPGVADVSPDEPIDIGPPDADIS